MRHRKPSAKLESSADKVRVELKLYEAGNGHGQLLKSCLSKLLSITSTSVQPEREFSTMNFVCSKTRNSLGHKTLDALAVLRAFLLGRVCNTCVGDVNGSYLRQ